MTKLRGFLANLVPVDRREVTATLSESSGTLRRLLILIALYAIPAIAVVQPVGDFDIWWHLRTGQWIVEKSAVPLTDPFSSFGQGKPWVAYSWLFEVLVYGLHARLALYGIVLFRALMALAIAVAVHCLVAKREPRFLVATVLAALAFLALAPLMVERPWLFTLLFFTLTLGAILDLRSGRHSVQVWVLPISVCPLGQRAHPVYLRPLRPGPCLHGTSDRSPDRPRRIGTARGRRRLTRTGGSSSRSAWPCVAATFVNPYHMRLYAVVLDYATQPAAFKLVNEHRAMDFRGSRGLDCTGAGRERRFCFWVGAAQSLHLRATLAGLGGLFFLSHPARLVVCFACVIDDTYSRAPLSGLLHGTVPADSAAVGDLLALGFAS